MAFPYLAPFDDWVQVILKQREKDKIGGIFKNPYAVLTSAAKVVKSTPSQDPKIRKEQIKAILKGELAGGEKSYNGCIIANNISSLDLSYRTGLTAVGIDFDGKIIEVEGETDRRVSTPIIESIDIDTDGANNTLKKANVKVRCFTLKQFEMFENFFLKPGMNVLLEFGDSSILGGLLDKVDRNIIKKEDVTVYRSGEKQTILPISRLEDCLIPKNKFEEFSNELVSYYKSSLSGTIKYFTRIESSLGTYDLMAGIVTNFNFSIEENLTYSVDIEITQANQISLALPINPKKKFSTYNTTSENKAGQNSEREQIVDSICLNFDLEKSKLESILSKKHPEGKDWINDEFFNYNKVDTTQKDQVASANPYISLRFILKILMNYVITENDNAVDSNFFEFIIPKYYTKKVKDKPEFSGEVEFIPVQSKDNMISVSDSLIFPTDELPKMVDSGKDNKIDIKSNAEDGRINGYNFHYNGDLFIPGLGTNLKLNFNGKNDRLGNALNIFIKYEDVVRMWKQELYRIDFLEKLLDLINKNSLGLFQLVYGSTEENGPGSILDYKLATSSNAKIRPISEGDTFRFKIGPNESIVRSLSFNFEMSNLVAGQTIFNSNKFVSETIKAKGKTKEEFKDVKTIDDIELPANVYKAIDMSTLGNADGWYSINNIELKTIQERTLKKIQQIQTSSDQTAQQILSGSFDSNKDASTEAEKASDIIKQYSTQFKFGQKDSDLKTLIYKDEKFILEKISQTVEEKIKKPTLSPIDISLVVDGFSGFRCGYCFCVDGVPEIYNKSGVFQITNVKHQISNDGWQTTIEAGYLARKFD